MTNKAKKKIPSVVLYIFIALFLLGIVLPFIWLLLGSFKQPLELFSVPPKILPGRVNLENYGEVFKRQPFGRYIFNSIMTSTIATLLSIVIASLASYSVARVEIKGKKAVLAALLSISLLPPVTLLNPLYRMIGALNLLNTHVGLALVIMVVEMPLAVWFLSGFFQSIPFEMEESAMIDGANMFVLLTRIIAPLVAPGLFTVAILVFINSWNQYLYALVLNPMNNARTVVVGLTLFQVDHSIPWHYISAAAIIVTLPLILVVLFLQKKIISGMLEGSVKG